MSEFIFKNINGEVFTIRGPEGMTQEQANAIFKQQSDTGSLTGLKAGDVVSAATQAADGLAAAAPQLGQGLASAAGLLPKGIDASSITSALGPNGAAVSNQISSAMTGAGPAIASFATGAAAALPGALAQISSTVKSGITVATNAVKSITSALSGTPTNGIDISNLAKQSPSLGGIGNLSSTDVTATLAQASKQIGQAADAMSNSLGAGKFGFDASQLERAGFVKPGTAQQFLAQGANDLTDVLKSPTVWTGKDGVKGIDSLLGNENLQNKIQQGLMDSGLKELKQVGIPTDKLTPQALSGLATNAAKSVEDAAKWATGGAGLPAGVKSSFDSMASNGAFAVNLTQGKAEESVLKERVVEPSSNTVNSETVDAAGARIVGNDKVPTASVGSSEYAAKVNAYFDFVNSVSASFDDLQKVTQALSAQPSITQDEWNSVNEQYQLIRATYNARNQDLSAAATAAVNAMPSSDPDYARVVNLYNGIAEKLVPLLLSRNQTVKAIIAQLANKIAT